MFSVKKYIIFIVVMLNCYGLKAQNDSVFNTSVISSFSLINIAQQNTFNLPPSTGSYYLFVFISPECPLCQTYSRTLNDLYKKFDTKIKLYGIVPGSAYAEKELNTFASTYHLQFPLLKDPQKKLSTYLLASTTPEVILLDNKGYLVYKGAVDNLLERLGKRRLKATSNYLEDAITAAFDKRAIAIKRTKAIGCKINNY